MLIGDMLFETAARSSDRPAVWYEGAWHTYGEIERAANRISQFLHALDVRPGDRVAIYLENTPDYVSAHFGVHKAGAVEVSLNVELKGEGLRQLLEHCEARALITSLRTVERWKDHLFSLPALRHIIIVEQPPDNVNVPNGCRLHTLGEAQQYSDCAPAQSGRIDVDLATIVYTSGSTGEPKGVMLSHLNLVSNTRSIAKYLQLTQDDRVLVVLPFHYIYGRSLLYSHILTGGAVILDNRFAFPAVVLDTMQEQAATCFAGVPSTFSILLHRTNLRSRTFPRLRTVLQAGGGMAPQLQRDVAEVFKPARLFVMYGSTEAAPRLTFVEPEVLPRKWGSIGRAIPNVEVIVADEDGRKLPPGSIGEIAARGSNIMMGYWKEPEATAKVLRHGYYFTGDLGYADEDGYIFLTGRSRDMIKTGGNRVSAKEIEDALLGIAGVVEAAVIAVPDEIMGEVIKAFVAPRGERLTERHLLQELGRRLPAYMLPKSFEFRESLPKNSSGKILKTALTAQS